MPPWDTANGRDATHVPTILIGHSQSHLACADDRAEGTVAVLQTGLAIMAMSAAGPPLLFDYFDATTPRELHPWPAPAMVSRTLPALDTNDLSRHPTGIFLCSIGLQASAFGP